MNQLCMNFAEFQSSGFHPKGSPALSESAARRAGMPPFCDAFTVSFAAAHTHFKKWEKRSNAL